MNETRNAFKLWLKTFKGKGSLGRTRSKVEKIKWILKKYLFYPALLNSGAE
jgi:hypothetical protein